MSKAPNRSRRASRKQIAPRAGKAAAQPLPASDVTLVPGRAIAVSVQNMLWGRAAGRCEFNNCNRLLSRTSATQDTRNLAEKAHIYAFSAGGPRASTDWPKALTNDVGNLLLVCHDCHVTIDEADGPDRYTAERLREMKRRHERRIEIATDVAPQMHSHVVTFGTYVGRHPALPAFDDVAAAMFPHRFPASMDVIELATSGGSQRDHDEAFWLEQRRELNYHFEQRVRVPAERGAIAHLSIFALAPQPLLIQLGALIGDILPADTFQRHREPPTWNWPEEPTDAPEFIVVAPDESCSGHPALVLAVSASVTPDRITRVLGNDAAIWSVTVPDPHNDIVKTRAMLSTFRACLRPLLNRIKARHGQTTPIHVFPVLPVSLAVELGRVRMPKADTPWELYDQNSQRDGFVRAFTLDSDRLE